MLKLAIVGRPNVGKSTLYNRLAGRREAIVHDKPGVTRDRRYGAGSIGDLSFELIDTPGLDDSERDTLAARMTDQSRHALKEADVVLFVIDAIAGLTPEDERFAQQIRRAKAKVVLVANKSETRKATAGIMEAYRLGFGEPIAISAEHGEGLADLYAAIAAHAPEEEEVNTQTEKEEIIQVSILGRPNVGKSTLFNTLLSDERSLTGPEAGITRDAVMVETTLAGEKIKLIDTAGMRRKSKVQDSLEGLSVSSTLRALQYSHVVVLVIDATMPLEKQDNAIAGLIEREGRACVVALNKSDLINVDKIYLKSFQQRLEHVMPQMRGIEVIPIVATTGLQCEKLAKAIRRAYFIWNKKISTAALNRWLEAALEENPPPLIKGTRLKFRYCTQTKARPPTFVFFSNLRKEIPAFYLRYLTTSLRDAFKLPGVPIRLTVRSGKNPYNNE
ncbi:MAG: ribosome biogenesis GTPase Der [Rickettsiales bacterium]